LKIGDPKQAIILSVAAIGAIVFFVTRLIPSKPSVAVDANRVAASQTGPASTASGLPVEVLRDAFSHPKLTEHFLASLPLAERQKAIAKPSPLLDLLPGGGEFEPVTHGIIEPALSEEEIPNKNTVTARQEDGEPKSKIELKGIMRATSLLAVLSIDGHESVTARLGEYIDGTHRITQFSQNAVQISSERGKTWLFVGHEVTEN
jgi:hypothetical protein